MYYNWRDYDAVTHPADIFVTWRYPISAPIGRSARYGTYVWLHDILEPFKQFPAADVFRGAFVGSRFHSGIVPTGMRALVTPNGLDARYFVDGPNLAHTLVYTSAPNRGLVEVLRAWPLIRSAVPVRLYVYYGFTEAFSKWAKSNMENYTLWEARVRELLQQACCRCVECALAVRRALSLSAQDGVVYVGHKDQTQIATALASAGFAVYPTSFEETGCISMMKAMAMGAIPITSRYEGSVLPELTDRFDLGPPARRGRIDGDDDWLVEWAGAVIAAVRNGTLADHREAMKKWARRTLTWAHVASSWSDEFDTISRLSA